jgi:thiosulfate dehydrogenase (quinone) large subunit
MVRLSILRVSVVIEGKNLQVYPSRLLKIADRFSAPQPGSLRCLGYVTVYLRLALGRAFLSAVADRFGIWGRAGTPLIAWGNFHNFLLYVGKLNPWFPASWIPAVGWVATFCEIAFGFALILGFRTRVTAFLSGLLALAFALGMALGLGIKAPLDYSVFTVSAASFLLACMRAFPLSLDALSSERRG